MAPLAPYLCFGGIEVANSNRTSAYLANGLAGGNFSISDCYCHGLDTEDEEDEVTYVDPASDDAPWYSDDWPTESADFLGFVLDDIRLLDVQQRTVSPKPNGGAAIGRQRLGGRVVQVRGMMYAANSRGMSWGERWLNEVLSGSACVDCGGSTAIVALYCVQDSDDVGDITEGSVQGILRELQEVGLVDGPTFTPERGGPECLMQAVAFQLVAGVPWLLADIDTPVETDESAGGTFVTPTWIGDYAARVQIDATSDMTDVVVRFWPRLDVVAPDDTEGMPCSEFIISDLREGDRFIIDGIKQQVTLIDGTSKLPSDGWALVDLTHGLPGFPEFGPCTNIRYEIAVASGTADVTWRFVTREL